MLDFLFSPFKAVYDLNTYIKATKQSVGKTLLFLLYILVLFSVLFFTVLAVKTPSLTPIFEQITDKVAQVIPEIQVKNGRLSANNDEYYEITMKDLFPDDEYQEISQQFIDQRIVFDTARTEAIYPTKLQQENISVLVLDKALYMVANGQVEVRNFNFNKDENLTINGQYILDNKAEIVKMIVNIITMIIAISTPIILGFFMILFMILAIIAVAISQLFVRANISFGDVCSICCYLLAPVFFFLLIAFMLPFLIPLQGLICFVICIIYAQFILNKIKFSRNKNEE